MNKKKNIIKIYDPQKMMAIMKGNCMQAIVKGEAGKRWDIGQKLIISDGEGRRVIARITEVIQISVDMRGIKMPYLRRTCLFFWTNAMIDELAKRECIRPATGMALRKDLMKRRQNWKGRYQVIRWKTSDLTSTQEMLKGMQVGAMK